MSPRLTIAYRSKTLRVHHPHLPPLRIRRDCPGGLQPLPEAQARRPAMPLHPHVQAPLSRRCLFFVVVCSCCHPQRVFRARRACPERSRRNPDTAPPQPSTPFSPQTPAHSSSLTAHSRNKKIAVAYPQKPQQIPLSSPSTPKNPSNSHPINHFPLKNSWHSSYAPLATINIWINSIEGQL